MPRGFIAWAVVLGSSYLSAKAIVWLLAFLWRSL